MSFPTIHRIVTGHDENGKAIVSSQGRLPTVVEIAAVPGTVFHEVWTTAGSPIFCTDASARPAVDAETLPRVDLYSPVNTLTPVA